MLCDGSGMLALLVVFAAVGVGNGCLLAGARGQPSRLCAKKWWLCEGNELGMVTCIAWHRDCTTCWQAHVPQCVWLLCAARVVPCGSSVGCTAAGSSRTEAEQLVAGDAHAVMCKQAWQLDLKVSCNVK